jgi:hypothetical protein
VRGDFQGPFYATFNSIFVLKTGKCSFQSFPGNLSSRKRGTGIQYF